MATDKIKNPFSSGLGRNGKIGAWVMAFALVGAHNYRNSLKSSDTFSKDEQETWNQEKKESFSDKK